MDSETDLDPKRMIHRPSFRILCTHQVWFSVQFAFAWLVEGTQGISQSMVVGVEIAATSAAGYTQVLVPQESSPDSTDQNAPSPRLWCARIQNAAHSLPAAVGDLRHGGYFNEN